MRVVADHFRTIAFAICDGQLPSNNKAGYVIRRILRRAVRYSYTFLGVKEPFIWQLIASLQAAMGGAYPELEARRDLIEKVVREEEESFLRTLATGIQLLEKIIADKKKLNQKVVDGKLVFDLYDTFGFPLDLTELILKENGLLANREEFEQEMKAQKERARNAAVVETDDWIVLHDDEIEEFIGYDYLEADVHLVKYRKVKSKNKELYHLVFNITPFYAESGGQVGDSGYIEAEGERYPIVDVKKENNLIIHIAPKLPADLSGKFRAVVDGERRRMTANNHTATHLLHKALRKHLGDHIEQKGSLVHPDYLRFDFSHFQKLSDEEIKAVEKEVNREIRLNMELEEFRSLPISEAQNMGAIALFGEKYGDVVRAIRFGESLELCGGTHVKSTGQIGIFKIVSESSVAAGIRRIEAVVGDKAEEFFNAQSDILKELGQMLHKQKDLRKSVEAVLAENSSLAKQVEALKQSAIQAVKLRIKDDARKVGGVMLMHSVLKPMFGDSLKDIAFQLRSECDQDMVAVLGVESEDKAQLAVIVSDELANNGVLNAVDLIKAVSGMIDGGGGGQKFFATAGGKKPSGLNQAVDKTLSIIEEKLS
jgi:alanyl-tRNA synthetase